MRRRPARIEALPLLDVIFLLLLVLFYSISTMQQTSSVPIHLEDIAASDKPRSTEGDVLISVNREGRIFVGQEELDLASLPAFLTEALDGHPEGSVRIEADREAKHGQVLALLATVSAAAPAKVLLIGKTGGP